MWSYKIGELAPELNTDEVKEGFVNNPRECYVSLSKA
jgi:hypothetical protein